MGSSGTPIAVFAAAELDDHDTPAWHPERRQRLDAALAGIGEAGLSEGVVWRVPDLATDDELGRVHDVNYVQAVEAFCNAGGGQLDPDTSVTPGSAETARRAAGAVLEAIDALRGGECEVAFAAGRPPGHHAVRDRAMGFCLFNNAAVGAAKIAAGGERVAIVDWDVHHGNGTQDMFYDDPRVLYVSTHESPLYPGTGQLRERGAGEGEGTTLNLPFPAGTAGDTYRAAFDDVVIPVVERFVPDWLIISAGFDAHRNDPLAGLALTSADYADLAKRLQALVPARRVIVVLEGGYDLEALTFGVGSTLSALVGGSFRPEPPSGGEIGLPTVTAARQLLGL
jgi:acetoin utilization deacetylase AcuC-like enzyme